MGSNLRSIRRSHSSGHSVKPDSNGEKHTRVFGSVKTKRFPVVLMTVGAVAFAIAGIQLLPAALPVLAEYGVLIGVSIFAVVMLGGAFAASVLGGPGSPDYNGPRYRYFVIPEYSDDCGDGDD